MLETFAALARSLAVLPRQRKTLLIGVDGPGGAGKSTFAQGLAAAFLALGGRAEAVQLDDFYRPATERPQGPLESRPPAGDFDWERLWGQVLQPLDVDQAAYYQRYDWPSDTLAEWHTLPPGGLVIVEGYLPCEMSLPLLRL
jgi:uridine kinase